MRYNKARAEKQWLVWKEAEEKKLRELGVDEDTIQRLHTYDWAQFNKERQYLQRWTELPDYWEKGTTQEPELPVKDAESLLNSIENPELFRILSKVDRPTLQIILYKLQGYTNAEIAKKTGIKETTIRQRIFRLKKKF